MKRKKKQIIVHSCPYEECGLPTSNWKYSVQAVYLLACFCVLIKNSIEFSFVSMGLFAAPILLDLCSTELFGKWFKGFRKIFISYNTVIICFCIFGIIGILQDNNNIFIVPSNALIFADYWISKTVFVVLLLPDLIVPLVLRVACPTKQSLVTEHIADSKSKNGVK